MREKVWEIIDIAHKDENEKKNSLYGLFDEPAFDDFDKICQKLKKSFYDLGKVTTKYSIFK